MYFNKKWKDANIDVNKIEGFSGLQSLPYSSADDLRSTWEKHSIEEIILTKTVALWYCTSGSMGGRKWMPWTYQDYTRTRKDLGEILMKFLTPEDRLMSIMLPAPFLSGSTAFRILEGTAFLGTPIEQLALTPEYVADSFGLLRKRQPTVMLCTPSLTLRMAEEIEINAPLILKNMAEEQKSALLKVASVVTKVKKIKPKNIFKEMRAGFFGAEPLDPFRKAIEDLWNIEAFDVYAFTEGYGAGYECQEHNGLHFPSPNGIIEIILHKRGKPFTPVFFPADKGVVLVRLAKTSMTDKSLLLQYPDDSGNCIVCRSGCREMLQQVFYKSLLLFPENFHNLFFRLG